MNKDLKDREFNIPENILNHIRHTLTLNPKSKGIKRANTLLTDKKVNYNQLKRIIHDINTLDTKVDSLTYNLYGGDLMKTWSKKFLDSERDLIEKIKKSKQKVDDMVSLNGIRKNSFNKNHKKSFNSDLSLNLIKSTPTKITAKDLKLYEELTIIKKLINY